MQQMLEKLAAMSPEQLDQLLENLVQKLAAFTGEGACPALAPPPPVAAVV